MTLPKTFPTQGPIADLFSSYVAAAAISTAHEIGLLDRLHDAGECATASFDGTAGRVDPAVLRSLLHALSWADVVLLSDGSGPTAGATAGTARPGPRFAEAYSLRGYFYWLVRGCGELFTTAPELSLDGEINYHRDMRAVAIGSRLIGDEEVEPLFDRILAETSFERVADLGCGSGQRLVRIARRNPGTRGVGVDISQASVALANETVAAVGLADRIVVHRGDVHALTATAEIAADLAEVDVITCVFMGHDFWPYDRCVGTLSALREAFPRVRRFLLCDVCRIDDTPGEATPIFRLGFESAHALMHTYLPTLAEWVEVFPAAGWSCRQIHRTTSPPGGVLFDLTPVRQVNYPARAGAAVTTADAPVTASTP